MYNKKEWVNDEIITKEALNNIENGIADLDVKMNDVATKKELQAIENDIAVLDANMNNVATKKDLEAIENDIAENNNEIDDLKEGLVASLVAQGHKVDKNLDWKDLFDILLVGRDSVPEVPNPDVGDGILLYKAGTQYNGTEFRNLCLANPQNSLTSDAICYGLDNSTHVWFSYDGYINFNDYDRIEITAYTENSQQQPLIGLGITSVSGQYGHQNTSGWEGTPHGNVTLMYNVTETKYTIPIKYTGPGYLLLWMHRNSGGLGRIYITEIRVIPKKTNDPIKIVEDEITIQVGERYDATKLYTLQGGYNVQYKYSSIIAIEDDHTIVGKEVGTTELEILCGGIIKTVTIHVVELTGGMVLFDRGFNTTNSDFGKLALPTEYVYESGGCITADLKNGVCTWGAFCSPNQVNFNNYDAVAITIYTENKQQTNTQLMVARGPQTVFMIGTGNNDVTTVMYDEVAFKNLENTTTPQTYVFNFADLRKQDNDMGYLGFRVKRGDGDGKVYISKIVVYPEGTYYTESIDE